MQSTEASNLPARLGFEELVREANAGSPEALAQLRSVLNENPQVWRSVGDLALHARIVLARSIAGGDHLAFESLMRHARELETQLLGSNPTSLERLTVMRIVACWLETHFAAIRGPEPSGETLKQARFALQVRESAEKRFNAAVKTHLQVQQFADAIKRSAASKLPTSTTPDTAAGNGHLKQTPVNRVLPFVQPPTAANGHTNRLNVIGIDSEPVKP